MVDSDSVPGDRLRHFHSRTGRGGPNALEDLGPLHRLGGVEENPRGGPIGMARAGADDLRVRLEEGASQARLGVARLGGLGILDDLLEEIDHVAALSQFSDEVEVERARSVGRVGHRLDHLIADQVGARVASPEADDDPAPAAEEDPAATRRRRQGADPESRRRGGPLPMLAKEGVEDQGAVRGPRCDHDRDRSGLESARFGKRQERPHRGRQGEPLAPFDRRRDDRHRLRVPRGEEGEARGAARRREEREDGSSAFVLNQFQAQSRRRRGEGFSRSLRRELRQRLPRERHKFLKIGKIAGRIDGQPIDPNRLGHPNPPQSGRGRRF